MTTGTQPVLLASPRATMLEFRTHRGFFLLLLLTLLAFWSPLYRLASLSLLDERYSHLIAMPVLSAGVLFMERRTVFAAVRCSLMPGLPLLAVALALHFLIRARVAPLALDDQLLVEILSILLIWAAGFALCYGVHVLAVARFPFLLLLLMVPAPSNVMDAIISVLQRGSAEIAYALFNLAGVPCFRNGVRFELPNIGIEIAPQCSAIHSGVALFITTLLLGHVFLKSGRGKLCLCLLAVPVAMFTNAVRIVTIWFLGTKVDPGFLYGSLHQRGGILFSFVSLSIIISALLLLRRRNRRRGNLTA